MKQDRARRAVDAALEASVVLSFSKVGYEVRRRLWSWSPPPRVPGRTALVTGGTSGIGRAAADELARLGMHVLVVGRDEERTARAAAELNARAGSGGGSVSAVSADLSQLSGARQLAEKVAGELAGRSGGLDLVLHNAGALFHDYQRSDAGVERTLTLHVLSPFVLTEALLPRLMESGRGRVVTMSSGGMYAQRLDVDKLDGGPSSFRGATAYAKAKRAQVVLTHEWARRHPGVVFQAMHPGWVATGALSEGLPRFAAAFRLFLRDPGQGADTAVWLSTSSEAAGPGGRFWLDRRTRREHWAPWTREEPGEAERLWEWCQRHSRSDTA